MNDTTADLAPVWPAANVVREPAQLHDLAAMRRARTEPDTDDWAAEELAGMQGANG